MIEVTAVVKMKITNKEFKEIVRRRRYLQISKSVAFYEDCLAEDEENFDGVVLNLGSGEMVFFSGDSKEIKSLLGVGTLHHIYFPEIE